MSITKTRKSPAGPIAGHRRRVIAEHVCVNAATMVRFICVIGWRENAARRA
jgi:hypothetical protein